MSSKDYFDQVARQWDNMRAGFFSKAVREKAFAVADVRPGQLAADVGAGTGFVTIGLLQKGVDVIAIDQSEAMVSEMRHKFAHVEGFDGRVGQAENLPVPDETVDYVFANMYLHHVESPPDAIKEMARLLKPGGKLVITDLDEHDFEFLKEEHHDRWPGFKREEVKQWFVAAGLKNSETDCLDENCRARSDDDQTEASVTIFVAFGQKG